MSHSDRRSTLSRPSDMGPHTWSVRVRGGRSGETVKSVVYARSNAFGVDDAVSFRETDPAPTALEYLLGALGADLVAGFRAIAERQGIAVEATEAQVAGSLDNVLVYLGVIGESGSPGIGAIAGTLYVSADADEDTLQSVWQETLRRSPLVNTLQRCAELSLTAQFVS